MSGKQLFSNNPVRPEPADAAAVQLIRSKVARAYGHEPEAKQELAEAAADRSPSKHQQFLLGLSQQGKNLAEIQTAWHHYYTQLSDAEKHEVWREFYAANEHTPYQKLFQKQQPVESRLRTEEEAAVQPTPLHSRTTTTASGVTIGDYQALDEPTSRTKHRTAHKQSASKKPRRPSKTAALARKTKTGQRVLDSKTAAKTRVIKQRIQHKVSAGGKLQARHHIQSLLFGMGMGAIVLFILLFSLFNEYIIAPFIQPSSKVSGMPIITSNITAEQAATPTVIVPKINIQIPVDFALTSNAEATIQQSLENGVVHYPSTVLPGQNGNGAYFGHSSQNLFNNGNYKFAFVRLRELTTGDVFSVLYQGKVYSYEVFAKEIVPPSRVSVLADTKGEQATAVLITCDPPGFSTNRLVVWGKQISPSPVLNSTPAPPAQDHPAEISSNGPTLGTRIWRTIQFWR